MDRHTATTAAAAAHLLASEELPPLEPGDCLDQPTFHARYEAMPESFRAELVEGMVIVPSPLQLSHGDYHTWIIGWLFVYRSKTPGTRSLDNTTTILSKENEPQPDGALILDPACGGSTRDEFGYVVGPPELIVEVASSSVSIDLHRKFRAYESAGILEYLVIVLHEKRARWFVRRDGRFVELEVDADRILRSEFFPGLWLDTAALFAPDAAKLLTTLDRGLATPEHAKQSAEWQQALDKAKVIAAKEAAAKSDAAQDKPAGT